ncbi:MAG: hypothetical protein ACOH2S_12090 [Janthinobacterium svalbardensis]
MSTPDLLLMIRHCAADARQRESLDTEARAHAFIATLSGALEQYDAIAAEMVFSILNSTPGGNTQ